MKPIVITGIGTGIGKTLISAILVEKFRTDYWKPIQSGELDNSDTHFVKSMVSNPVSVFHPEAYRLTQPFSPHKSAHLDGITIDRKKIKLPETGNKLIIEGAGGLMVPLTHDFLIVDLIKQLGAEVILVSQNYLGSINHTLLSLELLRARQIPLKGLVFNGKADSYSEDIISKYAGVSYFAHVPELNELKPEVISLLGANFANWEL